MGFAALLLIILALVLIWGAYKNQSPLDVVRGALGGR